MSKLVLSLPDTQIQVLERAAQQRGTSIDHLVVELIMTIGADETVADGMRPDPLPQSTARTPNVPQDAGSAVKGGRRPSAMGKFAHVPGSSDLFMRDKQRDIAHEDRERF